MIVESINLIVSIQKVSTGWTVVVRQDEKMSSVDVSFTDYDERGQDAFDEAIAFCKKTIEEGY